jgi:hypothetical protein
MTMGRSWPGFSNRRSVIGFAAVGSNDGAEPERDRDGLIREVHDAQRRPSLPEIFDLQD